MSTLLSFLGTGRYETVIYYWSEQEARPTHLFPIAAAELFPVERVVVFLTPQAQASPHFKDLQNALGDKLKPVSIPEGRSQDELWAIFAQVANAVKDGETVILDITHAFRSIPMMGFAVAAYLRQTKSVTIKHILYGAFEARAPSRALAPPKKGLEVWLHACLKKWRRSAPPQPRNRVPIFDLTPLLELLDWTSGAEALIKRGDAGLIAEKMIATHQILWRTGAGMPEKLKKLGQKLRIFSQALHLSRPLQVMRTAHELLPLLAEAQSEFQRWAPPFALLAEQIRRELEPLAFDKPDTLSRENLERQLRLVEYYLAKGLFVQAVTLAREWVVSYVLLSRQSGNWLQRSDRAEAEQALGAAVARLQERNPEPPPRWLDRLWRRVLGSWHRTPKSPPRWPDHLPQSALLADLWNKLGQLRNDLAHCGMSADARSTDAIERDAQAIPTKLRELLESAPTTMP